MHKGDQVKSAFSGMNDKMAPYLPRLHYLNQQLRSLENYFVAFEKIQEYGTALGGLAELSADLFAILQVGLYKLNLQEPYEPVLKCFTLTQKALQNYIFYANCATRKISVFQASLNPEGYCCLCEIQRQKVLKDQIRKITVFASTKTKTMDEQRRKLQQEQRMRFIVNQQGLMQDNVYSKQQDEHIKQITQILNNRQAILTKKKVRNSSNLLIPLLDVFNRFYSKLQQITIYQGKFKGGNHKVQQPQTIAAILQEFKASISAKLQSHIRKVHTKPAAITKVDACTMTIQQVSQETISQPQQKPNLMESIQMRLRDQIIERLNAQSVQLEAKIKKQESDYKMTVGLLQQRIKELIKEGQKPAAQLHIQPKLQPNVKVQKEPLGFQQPRIQHRTQPPSQIQDRQNIDQLLRQIDFLKHEISMYSNTIEAHQKYIAELEIRKKNSTRKFSIKTLSSQKMIERGINTIRDYKFYLKETKQKEEQILSKLPIKTISSTLHHRPLRKQRTTPKISTQSQTLIPDNTQLQKINITAKRISSVSLATRGGRAEQEIQVKINNVNFVINSSRSKPQSLMGANPSLQLSSKGSENKACNNKVETSSKNSSPQLSLSDKNKEEPKQIIFQNHQIKGILKMKKPRNPVRFQKRPGVQLDIKKSSSCYTKFEPMNKSDLIFLGEQPQQKKKIIKQALRKKPSILLDKRMNIFTIKDVDTLFFGLSQAHEFQLKGLKNSLQIMDSDRQLGNILFSFLQTVRQKTDSMYKAIKSFIKFPFQTVAHQIPIGDVSGDLTLQYLTKWIARFRHLHKPCVSCPHLQQFFTKLGVEHNFPTTQT